MSSAQAHARPHGSRGSGGLTTFLAGVALVLAVYLVLDRAGAFEPGVSDEPRPVVSRDKFPEWEANSIQIFEDNSKSVVHITTVQTAVTWSGEEVRQAAGTGTGFIWDEAGHVVTNHHVVKGFEEQGIVVRLKDKRTFEAKFIASYPFLDLAVIKILNPPKRSLQKIQKIGSSQNLRVGQWVYAIGNPFGLDQTLSMGVISALNRNISTDETLLRGLIQVDAAINPGNSGGPLLDSAGRLIGMNTAIYTKTGQSAGIGFAVPIDVINRKLPRLIAKRPAFEAGLGVKPFRGRGHVQLARADGYAYAVLLAEIVPQGAAAKAGLRPIQLDRQGRILGGDAIVDIDGEKVDSPNDLYRIVDSRKVGDDVKVKLARFQEGGGYTTEIVTITLQSLDG